MSNIVKKTPALPSIFDAPAPAPLNVQILDRTPYVLFAHPRNPSWGDIQTAIRDVEEGDPVLMGATGPQLLNPFRFIYWRFYQHYSMLDSTGKIVKSTLDKKVAEKDSNWKEHIEAGLLLFHGGGVIPAKATLKTTKVNCFHAAVEEAARAGEPEWGRKSADHRAALTVPKPWFRVVTTVRMKRGENRKSGQKYDVANGVCNPITAGEWGLLVIAFQSEDFMELVGKVNKGLDERIAEIKSKVV